MTEENNETQQEASRIEEKKEVSGEQLRKGGFGFRLRDATPEEETAFYEAMDLARKEGRNMAFNQNVEVYDLNEIVRPEPVPAPEPVVETKEEEPKQETQPEPQAEAVPQQEQQAPPAQPEQQMPPQPQQPQYYGHNPYYQVGQQRFNYDPFTGHPLNQNPPPQQPQYAERVPPQYPPQYDPYYHWNHPQTQPQQNPNAETPPSSNTRKDNQQQ